MFETYKGEIFALITALLWSFGAVIFEGLSKKNGADAINVLRLMFAFGFLSIFTFFSRDLILPLDADSETWLWLFLSGIIGFTLGDLFLFKAFVIIGARVSMLIMSLAPPIAAFFGYLILDEKLKPQQIWAIMITLFGVVLVVLQKTEKNEIDKVQNIKLLKYPVVGLLLALGGAIGQGMGLVLTKLGVKDYDAFAAAQIRILAGILGLSLYITFTAGWNKIKLTMQNRKNIAKLSLGAFFASFLGISFSLLAVKNTETGIAGTLMAVQPVILIPFSFFYLKEKVNYKDIAGALITVFGVALFFL
jgi:drug/metabolite transporter (DMT)-like permease